MWRSREGRVNDLMGISSSRHSLLDCGNLSRGSALLRCHLSKLTLLNPLQIRKLLELLSDVREGIIVNLKSSLGMLSSAFNNIDPLRKARSNVTNEMLGALSDVAAELR